MDRPTEEQLCFIAELLNGTELKQAKAFMKMISFKSDLLFWKEMTEELMTEWFDNTAK